MAALCRVGQGRMESLNHRHCLRARASCQDYGPFQMPRMRAFTYMTSSVLRWENLMGQDEGCQLVRTVSHTNLRSFCFPLPLPTLTFYQIRQYRTQIPGIVRCAGWFPMPLSLPPSTFWAVNLHLSSVNVPSSALSSRDALKAVLLLNILRPFLPLLIAILRLVFLLNQLF